VHLLTPVQLGQLQLRNRVVMAPMTRTRADAAGCVGELTAQYYAQRATAGLIITEATAISAEGQGYLMAPGIWNDAQVDAWRAVTRAVHAAGGMIVMQLWHCGRVSHSSLRDGQRPVAPSALRIEGQQHHTPGGRQDYEVPRALSLDEIGTTIDDFARGARNAKAAGFDGVELHGAYGYLPHAFLVDGANQRSDAYGGSIANRCRFVLEVMERLVGIWGEGRVGIRLSPTLAINGMVDSDTLATFSHLIARLNGLPLAYLHLMRAMPDPELFPSWPRDVIASFGPLVRGPLLVNGGYERDTAETVVEQGGAQAVSFGRSFIANPDLVARFASGAALAEAEPATFYGGGAKGYVDYPPLIAASSVVNPSLDHHETFVIVAETLAGWRSPATPEGADLLAQHYGWAHTQHASGALLFAGPIDVEALAPGAPTPVGQVSGLLVLRAASKQAAEAIAQSDPFHLKGCRHNAVHSWSIRFAQPAIAAALASALTAHPAVEAPSAHDGAANS